MIQDFKNVIQSSITHFLNDAKEVLSKTILQLESNEVLSQMKNDQSLYDYKIALIREVISDHFNIQKIMKNTFLEINQLKIQNAKLQEEARRKDSQYLQELGNIQQNCQIYMTKKEEEIQQIKNQYQGSNYQVESQFKKLKNQISQLKKRNMELEEQNNLNLIAQQKKQKFIQDKIKQLQINFDRQIKKYEDTIETMKNDMHLIKSEWQKKCQQVLISEKAKYKQQLLINQQKMHKQLEEYVDNLKLGKNVVIKQDQQLLNSKLQIMKDQFKRQISQKENIIESLILQTQKLKEKYKTAEQKYQYINIQKTNLQMQFEKNCYTYQLQIQKLHNEIEKQNYIMKEKENYIKSIDLQIQSLKTINHKFEDEVKFYKKRIENIEKENQDFNNEICKFKKQKNKLNQQIDNLTEIAQGYKSSFEKVEKNSLQISKKLQKAIQQKDKMQIQFQKNINSIQKNVEIEIEKRKKKTIKLNKAIDKINKLHIQIKKMQKQVVLFTQQARYQIQITKTKLSNSLHHQFFSNIEKYQQQLSKKFNQKMVNLIDEVQQNQKESKSHFLKLSTQNQRLIQQLRQYDLLLQKKQQQYNILREKQIAQQTDEIKKITAQQIKKEKKINQQLATKLKNAQFNYQKNIDTLQKTINFKIKSFTQKWGRQLFKAQQDIKNKQKQIVIFAEKIKALQQEKKRISQLLQMQKQQSKKFKHQIQQLSSSRDDKMHDLIKRLERQSKHKIHLEKELKQIRKKFGDCIHEMEQKQSFRDRQRNNGIRQNKNETNIKENSSSLSSKFKQKQLSQIRQMIAKTYKIVGSNNKHTNQAEKDINKDGQFKKRQYAA